MLRKYSVRPSREPTTHDFELLDHRCPLAGWKESEVGSANAKFMMPPLGDLIDTLSGWLAHLSMRLSGMLVGRVTEKVGKCLLSDSWAVSLENADRQYVLHVVRPVSVLLCGDGQYARQDAFGVREENPVNQG